MMRHFIVLAAVIALSNANYRGKPSEWSNGQEQKGQGKSWLFAYWPYAGQTSKSGYKGNLLGAAPFISKPEDYLTVCQDPYRQYEVQQDVLASLRDAQKNFQHHTDASSTDDQESVIDVFQTFQRQLPNYLAAIEGAIFAVANLSTSELNPDKQCVSKIHQQLQLTQGSLHELEKEVTRSAVKVQERTGKDRLVQIQSHLTQLMKSVKELLRKPSKEQIKIVYGQCQYIRPAKRMQQARDALKTFYDYDTLKGQREGTKADTIEAVTGIVLQATELHAICHGVEHYESSGRTQKYIWEQDLKRGDKLFDQVKTIVQKIARGSRWFF